MRIQEKLPARILPAASYRSPADQASPFSAIDPCIVCDQCADVAARALPDKFVLDTAVAALQANAQ
jgi:hypothetical protein